jgi:hypothetical protein
VFSHLVTLVDEGQVAVADGGVPHLDSIYVPA